MYFIIFLLLVWVISLELRFQKLIKLLCYNHNRMKKSILNRKIEISEIHKNIPYNQEEQFIRDVCDDWLYEEDYK